jgi:hypothetical protein
MSRDKIIEGKTALPATWSNIGIKEALNKSPPVRRGFAACAKNDDANGTTAKG